MPDLTDEGHELVTGLAQDHYYQSEAMNKFDGSVSYCEAIKHDIHRIGTGFGREVFSLPSRFVEDADDDDQEYIVKFPEYSIHETANGLAQNEYEIEAWEDRLVDYREYLIPIIDYHEEGWWIVMPWVDFVDPEDPVAQQRVEELEVIGFEFEDEAELGQYQGELRLLDYGYKVNIN